MLDISNINRTDWSAIQGVIGRVISKLAERVHEADLKLRARLPLNCTTRDTLLINRINNKFQW